MDDILPEFPLTFRVQENEITIRQSNDHKNMFPVFCNGISIGILFYRERPNHKLPWGYQTPDGKIFAYIAQDVHGAFALLYNRIKGQIDESTNPL